MTFERSLLTFLLLTSMASPVVAQEAPSLPAWQIAAIVGGSVLALLLCAYGVYMCRKRRKPAKKTSSSSSKKPEKKKVEESAVPSSIVIDDAVGAMKSVANGTVTVAKSAGQAMKRTGEAAMGMAIDAAIPKSVRESSTDVLPQPEPFQSIAPRPESRVPFQSIGSMPATSRVRR